jgi:hypothetical protein
VWFVGEWLAGLFCWPAFAECARPSAWPPRRSRPTTTRRLAGSFMFAGRMVSGVASVHSERVVRRCDTNAEVRPIGRAWRECRKIVHFRLKWRGQPGPASLSARHQVIYLFLLRLSARRRPAGGDE